jgi:hypothetical protein
MTFESRDAHRRKRDSPPRRSGLGWYESQLAPDTLERVHDFQIRVAPRVDVEVYILPAKTQQLCAAKAEVQGDHVERRKGFALGSLDDSMGLSHRQPPTGTGVRCGDLNQPGDVA